MRRTEWVTTEPLDGMPEGTFVVIVDPYYIPKETRERLDPHGWLYDPEHLVFAYTPKGMMLLSCSKLRPVR